MQRKVELEMHGNLESAKDLFVHHSVKKSTLDYRTLKDEIQIKRASSYGTSRTYEVAYNAICEFLGVVVSMPFIPCAIYDVSSSLR